MDEAVTFQCHFYISILLCFSVACFCVRVSPYVCSYYFKFGLGCCVAIISALRAEFWFCLLQVLVIAFLFFFVFFFTFHVHQLLHNIYPYKPGVLFNGQKAASHLGLFCLLTSFSSKNEKKKILLTPLK